MLTQNTVIILLWIGGFLCSCGLHSRLSDWSARTATFVVASPCVLGLLISLVVFSSSAGGASWTIGYLTLGWLVGGVLWPALRLAPNASSSANGAESPGSRRVVREVGISVVVFCLAVVAGSFLVEPLIRGIA